MGEQWEQSIDSYFRFVNKVNKLSVERRHFVILKFDSLSPKQERIAVMKNLVVKYLKGRYSDKWTDHMAEWL